MSNRSNSFPLQCFIYCINLTQFLIKSVYQVIANKNYLINTAFITLSTFLFLYLGFYFQCFVFFISELILLCTQYVISSMIEWCFWWTRFFLSSCLPAFSFSFPNPLSWNNSNPSICSLSLAFLIANNSITAVAASFFPSSFQ